MSLRSEMGKVGVWEIAKTVVGTRLGKHRQFYLAHAITARCNARCGFCAWNPDFYEAGDELTTDEVKDLYRRARAQGFFALSLWGGEPLVRKDFGELAAYAKRLGFATSMVTNGALMERKMDQVLPSVDRICFSLDHPSDKHDKMRGIPGLFGKVLSAILQIRDRDPKRPIVLTYTIQKENADRASIERMARLVRSLGVVVIYNAMRLEPAVDGGEEVIDLAKYNPPTEAIVEAFRVVKQLKKEGYPIVNSQEHIGQMIAYPPRYHCHWPKVMLPIEANGDVVDCMQWGIRPIGNVRETPFEELLDHPRLRALAGKAGEACHKCVSLHRVDISSSWEGRVEPLVSWGRSLL